MSVPAKSNIPGISPAEALLEFGPTVLNRNLVEAWITDQLHPGGIIRCPNCREELQSPRSCATFGKGGRVVCQSCGRFYNNRCNTILHKSPFPSGIIYLLAVMIALDVPKVRIAETLHMSINTVKRWSDIFSATGTVL